jgi:dihydropyrimidinase
MLRYFVLPVSVFDHGLAGVGHVLFDQGSGVFSIPAKIFNLYPRKGAIAVGSDADFVLYDPDGSHRVDVKDLHSNTDNSIFQGMEMVGRPIMTILDGQVIAEDGELADQKPGFPCLDPIGDLHLFPYW